jgi:hypothetical protein
MAGNRKLELETIADPDEWAEGEGGEVLDVWVDYDEEGDVLYLSFEKPQQATGSVMGGADAVCIIVTVRCCRDSHPKRFLAVVRR